MYLLWIYKYLIKLPPFSKSSNNFRGCPGLYVYFQCKIIVHSLYIKEYKKWLATTKANERNLAKYSKIPAINKHSMISILPWQDLLVLHYTPACLLPTNFLEDSFCSDWRQVEIAQETQRHWASLELAMCQSTARVGAFAQLAQEHSAIFNKHNNSIKLRTLDWKLSNCMCIDQSW